MRLLAATVNPPAGGLDGATWQARPAPWLGDFRLQHLQGRQRTRPVGGGDNTHVVARAHTYSLFFSGQVRRCPLRTHVRRSEGPRRPGPRHFPLKRVRQRRGGRQRRLA